MPSEATGTVSAESETPSRTEGTGTGAKSEMPSCAAGTSTGAKSEMPSRATGIGSSGMDSWTRTGADPKTGSGTEAGRDSSTEDSSTDWAPGQEETLGWDREQILDRTGMEQTLGRTGL